MARDHGAWCKIHEGIFLHEKTRALANAIAEAVPEFAAVPAPFRRNVCAAMVVRLTQWCMRESEWGRIDHLDGDGFAAVVEWPREFPAASVDALRDAFLGSGYVDHHECGSVTIHDFEGYAKELMRKRVRDEAKKPGAVRAETRRPMAAGKAPDGRRKGASCARQSRVEKSRDKKETRSARPAQSRGARPAPPAASIEKASEPEPATAVAVLDEPPAELEPATAEAKAPTSAWVDEWADQLQRRGMPDGIDRSQIGGLLKRLRGLWEKWGSDQQADIQVRQVIAAWFDSDWGAQTGYGVRPFLAGGKVNELVAGLLRAQSPPRDRRSEERHQMHMAAGMRGLMEAPASYELDDAALAAITSS